MHIQYKRITLFGINQRLLKLDTRKVWKPKRTSLSLGIEAKKRIGNVKRRTDPQIDPHTALQNKLKLNQIAELTISVDTKVVTRAVLRQNTHADMQKKKGLVIRYTEDETNPDNKPPRSICLHRPKKFPLTT